MTTIHGPMGTSEGNSTTTSSDDDDHDDDVLEDSADLTEEEVKERIRHYETMRDKTSDLATFLMTNDRARDFGMTDVQTTAYNALCGLAGEAHIVAAGYRSELRLRGDVS